MPRNQTLTIAAMIAIGMAMALPAHATIRWAPDLATAQQAAAQYNRLVLVHFWAPSCGPCLTLERNVFSQPYVNDSILADYVPVKIDASRDFAIAQKFGVRSWPTDVILTPDGQVVRAVGCPQDPGQYVGQLRSIAAQMPGRQQGTYARQGGPQAEFAASPGAAYGAQPGGPVNQRQLPADPRGTSFAPADRETYNPYANQGYPDASRAPQGSSMATTRPPVTRGYAPSASGAQPPRTNQGQFGGPERSAEAFADGGSRDNYRMYPGQRDPSYPPGGPGRGNGGVSARQTGQIDSYDPYGPGLSARGGERTTPPVGPGRVGATAPMDGRLPTGPRENPPLGLDGHCPVTLKKLNRWEKGDAGHGAIHRGRTYLFAGLKQQQEFLTRPDQFSPVLSGNDAVEFVDKGRLVPGDRQYGLEYANLMYLFVSEESLQKFARSPQRYSISVHQAMQLEPGQRSSNQAGTASRPH
jgi:YHS domain-containing protein